MTGYGYSQYENELIWLKVEIKSVNSRYLDLNLRLPKIISFTEDKVRTLIRSKVERGKLDCFVTVGNTNGNFVNLELDKSMADSYHNILEEIRKEYKLKSSIYASQVASYPGVVNQVEKDVDNDKILQAVLIAFEQALDALTESRRVEGKELYKDCISKIEEFKEHLDKIKELSLDLPKLYKEKLEKRLTELLSDSKVDETRLAQEVAFFADRACVDEEITRLTSHISQFVDNMEQSHSGKKIDFLIQEMLRETNTIASKANNLEITKNTLEMKYVLEKIREQIQNLE